MIERPIHILLLDDDAEDFVRDFDEIARMNRVIILEHITNAEEGIEYIRKNHSNIDAIIIDGFFKLNKTSSNKKDKTALVETIEELKILLHRDGLSIPFCILTGYIDSIQDDSILRNQDVFRKGKSNKELFERLKEKVRNNQVYSTKCKYHEVFEVFDDGLLPMDKIDDLVRILLKLESKAQFNSDDAFNPIRKMYEVIIGELHEQTYTVNKEQNIVPKELFTYNNVLNVTGSCYYLSGEEFRQGENVILPKRDDSVWPTHISGMARMLIQTTHLISHDYPEHVGHYTYKSTVYALLDLIIWYRDFITKYKAAHTL